MQTSAQPIINTPSIDFFGMDNFQGIPIFIEYQTGDTRKGTNSRGEKWERTMACPYGYVPGRTTVDDGEELDFFLGPDLESPRMWMVEQLNDQGEHDEWKCMLGFSDRATALRTYLKHYPKDWMTNDVETNHVGDVIEMPVFDLKEEVETHKTADYQLGDAKQQDPSWLPPSILPDEHYLKGIPSFEDFIGKDKIVSYLCELDIANEAGLRKAFTTAVQWASSLNFPCTIWRMVRLRTIDHLKTERIGTCWSTEESKAQIVYNEQKVGNNYTLRAKVLSSAVDWHQTIYNAMSIYFEQESELTLKSGAPFTLEAIRKDKGPWESYSNKMVTASQFRSAHKVAAKRCLTPDAMYHLNVGDEEIESKVTLPLSLNLSEADSEVLEDRVHDAMETAIAPFWPKGASVGLIYLTKVTSNA